MLEKRKAVVDFFKTPKKEKDQKRFEGLLFRLAVFDFSLDNIEKSTKELKKLLVGHTHASGCTIMILDDHGQLWKLGEQTTYPFRIGEGVAGWAAKCKKAVYIKEVSEDSRYRELYRGKKGGLLSIPILKDNKTIGVLNFTYKANNVVKKKILTPTIPNKELMKFFSEKIKNILENVILYQKDKERKEELEARKEISSILLDNEISFKKKVEEITKKIRVFTKVKQVTFCIMESREVNSLIRTWPIKKKIKTNLDSEKIISLYAKKRKDKSLVEPMDLSEELDFELFSEENSGHTTMQPLLRGSKLTGFVLLEDSTKNISNLSISEKNFLTLVAERVQTFLSQLESSKKIVEEKEKWRQIFQNDNDGILFITKDKLVIETNPKARDIFGSSHESLTGKPLFSLFSFLDPTIKSPYFSSAKTIKVFDKDAEKKLEKKIDTFFSTGKKVLAKEHCVETKNGRAWISLSMKTSIPIRKNSENFGVIKVRDITKRKELDNEKNEFISLVSHELRTPLSAMRGFLSMVLNENYGKLNEGQTKALRRTEKSTERMVGLVEDILDVSRVDLGKYYLEREPINLVEAICGSLKETAERINSKKIKVKIQGKNMNPWIQKGNKEIPRNLENTLFYVLVDKNRLTQIVQNLLDNAVNYSFPEGAVDISFTEKGKDIVMKVSDKGVGILKNDQENLFKKFHRIQNPLTSQVDGTGLGLYITKKLVEAHGGIISVTSEKNKGSTFYVTLPKADKLPSINLKRKEIYGIKNITS